MGILLGAARECYCAVSGFISLFRYKHTGRMVVSRIMRKLVCSAATAKQAIQNAFDYMIEGNEYERLDCFFVNAATELTPRDREVDEIVNQAFNQAEQRLSVIIRKGQQAGEISRHQDAQILAEFLQNAFIGICVLVRTSASKDKLYRIKEMFLNLLFNETVIRKFQTSDLKKS